MEEPEENESSSSEESHLTIVESPKKKKRGKSKPPMDFETLDKTIESTLSKFQNLTKDSATKLLCKLVKNDHVLALALLKAEEEENRERGHSESSEIQSGEDEAEMTPKLTRLKAKQLNKQLPIPVNLLDNHQPDEEVVKLIQEELKSDDEDEEYQPDKEPYDSDGDVTNTTFSDIDSQPSTPGSALINNDDFDSPQKSGEFKIPRTPLTAEEQENIARRTRSKLCLETTPIETIESTFIPPDIEYDLNDFNQDFENEDEFEWKDFLCKFSLPLPDDDEKYDEADPDFLATDPVPYDKEELRSVRVPKKEVNDLLSELFGDECDLSSIIGEPSTSSNKSSSKNVRKQTPTPSKNMSKYPPKVSSRLYSPAELNTPPHKSENRNLDVTPEQTPTNPHHYYSPHLFQTPLKSIQQTPFQSPAPPLPIQTPTIIQSPIIPQYSSPIVTQLPAIQYTPPTTLIASPQLPQSPSVLVINQNQLEIVPLSDGSGTLNASPIINQGFYINGSYTLPQFQNVVIQIPTIDLLQNGLNFTLNQNSEDLNESQATITNLTDDVKRNLKKDAKFNGFDHLNHCQPKKVSIDENQKGFTDQQNAIFRQQLQMHCQLLAVNFLQFYAHPYFWQQAEKQKENLNELKGIVNSSHIKNCLELCESWEKDLQSINESNKNYINFLNEEIELDQDAQKCKRGFRGRFHNRLMERVLQSNAIFYPSLLPSYPFRSVKFSRVNPSDAELSLIATGYEHVYDKLYHELNFKRDSRKPRIPRIQSVVSSLIRQIGSFRNENGMMKIIEKYKSYNLMNPIKYYFMHKKAPAVEHKILPEETPPTSLKKGSLPAVWERYKNCPERAQLHENLTENGFTSADEGVDCDVSSISSVAQEKEEISLNDSLKLKIINDNDNPPQIVISYVNPFKSPIKSHQKTKEEKEKNLTSILKKFCVEKSPSKKKSVNFDIPILETPNKNQKILRSTLGSKLQATLEKFFKEYSNNIQSSKHLIRLVFVRLRSFDIYWRLVDASMMLSKKNKTEGSNGHSSDGAKHRKQITTEEYSKRINRKLADNRAMIMQNAKSENSTEKDCSYAHNFLEKVKKTLSESGDDALYVDFMRVLTSFNPEVESVPELYYKMENLLIPNYSDLLDLFLTFLLPEHAAEIGKFCEHFLLTKMSELIQHLNLYFQKQPSHMKKIYLCLNELSNDPNLNIDKLKAKILPLLKGNQLLIEWFMGIFETPADNLDDYETLHLKKPLSEGEICDYTYEELQSSDLVESESNNFSTCGVKYINGKIMYRCKTLLPAKISFLINEPEKSSADKPESSSNWCVHEIRKHVQFSDKRKVSENGEEASKKKKTNKKFKVCDSQTLHAHALRLNPGIHAQTGEKVADVLQLLEINSQTISTTQDSPKKQIFKGTKKSGSSPKKNLTKSPSSSSEASSSNTQSPSPSKALQTAKKLRAVIDDSEDEQQPTKKLKADSSSEESEVSSNNIEETIEEQTEEPEAWTRDEDKLILEEIRGGKSSKSESIENLIKTLERRSSKEIQDRYEFLLNLLAKIAAPNEN